MADSIERHAGSCIRARRSSPRRRLRSGPARMATGPRPRRPSRPPAPAPAPAAAAPAAPGPSRRPRRLPHEVGRAARRTPSPPRCRPPELLQHRHQKGLNGAVGRTSPLGGAIRPLQPRPAAPRRRAPCAAPAGLLPIAKQVGEPLQPAPAPPRPSGPRIQRRSSAASWPDSAAEKAASAASNRWWPSSKTMRFSRAVSASPGLPRAARAPSNAAWLSTSAWLAITMSARRLPRIAFSTKQAR